MEKSEKNNVKDGETNNGEMNEMFGNLSEDETVYEFFGSDSLMSFTGNTTEEDDAWAAMNERGYQMADEAIKADVNVKKLLAKIVIDYLENEPGSLHDLTDEIMYGKMRKDIGKMSRKNIERILFFQTLPELGKLSMIKMKGALRLGGGSEYIYYM